MSRDPFFNENKIHRTCQTHPFSDIFLMKSETEASKKVSVRRIHYPDNDQRFPLWYYWCKFNKTLLLWVTYHWLEQPLSSLTAFRTWRHRDSCSINRIQALRYYFNNRRGPFNASFYTSSLHSAPAGFGTGTWDKKTNRPTGKLSKGSGPR